MKCSKCSTELPKNETRCPSCGTEVDNTTVSGVAIAPRGFSSKRNIIIIVIAALVVLGGIGAAVAFGVSHSASQGTSGFQLAEKYLSEQNYEQAIIAFEQVLEIEPMNVDAYLGLAEAYIGLGDTEKALETLCKGLEITGDARLQAKIDELTKPPVSSSTSSVSSSSKPVESSSSSSKPAECSSNSSSSSSSKPPASSSTNSVSSSSSTSSVKPAESESKRGTMGTATVRGKQYDIATTTNLCIDNGRMTVNDLVEIGKLANLEKLTLKFLYEPVENDGSPLINLKNLVSLKELYISSGGLTDSDIVEIGKITSLERLDLHSLFMNKFSNISPLGNLTNLTYLNLSRNSLTDISALSNLTKLTELNLYWNDIEDISVLGNLTELFSLNLRRNKISDISPLSGLINLSGSLDLSENQISNLSPLAVLSKVTSLNLQKNKIIDIKPLAKLPLLSSLVIYENPISDVTPLEEFAALKSIWIYCDSITDFSPFTKVPTLTSARLGTKVSDEDKQMLREKAPNCKFNFS